MTDLRKAAEQALEALEKQHNWMVANGGGEMFAIPSKKAINELRQALAQPEQEPVCFLRETAWSYEIAPWDDPNGFPVYTAPPKREWVGLTDEEIWDLGADHAIDLAWAREIEAKLKEKNV